MSGILHLRPVPKLVKGQPRIVQVLQRGIRQFCDTDHGRMVSLEDLCHDLVSWYRYRDDECLLVRVANIDKAGRPFAASHFFEGFVEQAKQSLTDNGYVVWLSGEIYEAHYHSGVFGDNPDYLYAPNNVYCKTMVAIRTKRRAAIDCSAE